MVHRVFIECVLSDLPTSEDPALYWLGLADHHGRTFSAINADVAIEDLAPEIRDALQPLALDNEPRLTPSEISEILVDWLGSHDVEWWAWPPSTPQIEALGIDEPEYLTLSEWAGLDALRELVQPWPTSWEQEAYDVRYTTAGAVHPMNAPTRPNTYHPAQKALWLRDVWVHWHDQAYPPEGIPIAAFYIPLPQPLPVPDGYTCQVTIPDAAPSRRTKLGAVAEIQVSLSCKQVIDSESPLARDTSALFRAVAEMLEEPIPDQMQMPRQMTVVEAYVPIEREIDLEERSDFHEFSDDFDLALSAVRDLQEAYGTLTQQPVLLVSLRTLPPVLPMWVGRLERYGEKPRRDWSGGFQVNPSAGLTDFPKDELDDTGLEDLGIVLRQRSEATTFAGYADLRMESWNQRHIHGNWRLAGLIAAISGEVLLDAILLHLRWEMGTNPQDAAGLFAPDGPSHRKRVLSQYAPLLGGDWNWNGNGAVARYLNDVVLLRHRIVHRGYTPTLEEVDLSLNTVLDVERFLGDRLTSDDSLRRFTRTARAFCGNNGLEQRGRLTSHVRQLLEDPSEPNWSEMFERWRLFVDFAITGLRPAPGRPDNEQLVVLLIWGRGVSCWIVHDLDARAVAVLPRDELEIDEDLSLKLDQFSQTIYDADADVGPQRVFVEGARYDSTDLQTVWIDDYEVLPELDIYLPDHRRGRRPWQGRVMPSTHS